MPARTLIDLQVYQRALVGSFAVSALLKHPRLCKDAKLSGQLAAAADSVCTHIAEGFAQPTDGDLATHLLIARGSAHAIRSHLVAAHHRDYITSQELEEIGQTYVEIGKMLTRFIHYHRGQRESAD